MRSILTTMRVLAAITWLALLLGGGRPGVAAPAATLLVKSMDDQVNSSCGDNCTLRDALAAANAGDTIEFGLNGAIILSLGELEIGKNITISGPSADLLSITANPGQRIFKIVNGTTVKISGVAISNNALTGSPAQGGCIFNDGTLTLERINLFSCTVVGAAGANGFGGGIYNNRTLTLTESSVSYNAAGDVAGTGSAGYGHGGGIYNSASGVLTINGVTFNDNQALGGNNNDGLGGALFQLGTANLTNVTFNNNSAMGGTNGHGHGGAIYGTDGLHLDHVTIAGNTANSSAGGLYSNGAANGGPTLHNSIIAGNTVSDIFSVNAGNVQSLGYNLIQITAGYRPAGNTANDITGKDPQLGPLLDNGGATSTMVPLETNVVVNGGDPADPLRIDQRGIARPQGARTDIGAVEVDLSTSAVRLQAFSARPAGGLPLGGLAGLALAAAAGLAWRRRGHL